MSTRDMVLAALREADTSGGVSGESIAEKLGISRVAVSKHVSVLRELGYRIEARMGEGYTLVSSPDLPIPSEVLPLLSDPMWVRLEGGIETRSTNDDARKLAENGAPQGTVVLAARQSAGKGRLGRQWSSPQGGAYLSVVLRPQCAAVELAPLPLVVAVAVARALETLGAELRLKWPNDVLLSGGKLAGILLEMKAEGDAVEWVVVGVGINIAAVEAFPGAAYLEAGEAAPGSARIAAAVLDSLAATYREWLHEGFSALRAEFEARHTLQGEAVTVRDMTGGVVAQGVVRGVDDLGRLVLATAEGERHISSGDVTLRGPA